VEAPGEEPETTTLSGKTTPWVATCPPSLTAPTEPSLPWPWMLPGPSSTRAEPPTSPSAPTRKHTSSSPWTTPPRRAPYRARRSLSPPSPRTPSRSARATLCFFVPPSGTGTLETRCNWSGEPRASLRHALGRHHHLDGATVGTMSRGTTHRLGAADVASYSFRRVRTVPQVAGAMKSAMPLEQSQIRQKTKAFVEALERLTAKQRTDRRWVILPSSMDSRPASR